MQKKWWRPKLVKNHISHRRWKVKLSVGDQDLRTPTLLRDLPERGEERENLLGESEGSPPQPQDSLPDAGEARNDSWSISGDFIYFHHVEPRVKLYMPRGESFPIPLKYIDVTRATHTTLDVMQESRIHDYRNIEGARDLSNALTGFTQFTSLMKNPPDGYTWSGGWRLTKRQATSRPDHLWPEIWKDMAKASKQKEKSKWTSDKSKLDNARKLRGIYFIVPEYAVFTETSKNARKKLEIPMVPAMPRKMKFSKLWGDPWLTGRL